MIKITYNRNNPLAFRFISHFDQPEASQLLSRVSASRDSRRNDSKEEQPGFRHQPRKKSQLNQPNFVTQQTKIITDFGNRREVIARQEAFPQSRFNEAESNRKMKRSELASHHRKESRDQLDVALLEFVAQQYCNVQSLRQAYLRVWFDKMALENSYAGLLAESTKKDELINQLRQEIGQKNGQQGNIFYNPQTPMHMNQNKTTYLPNQNSSISQVQTPSPMSHWGGMHPSRNFNVTTTRSNM